MDVNRLSREEGKVFVEVAEIFQVAEEQNGPWPELDEPDFSSVPPVRSNFAERVMWTMVGLLGAVTVYGVTTGDREILMAVLAIAAGALLRLAGLTPRRARRGEKTNDSRAKGPQKKRRESG
jgi:hypothetical protein